MGNAIILMTEVAVEYTNAKSKTGGHCDVILS